MVGVKGSQFIVRFESNLGSAGIGVISVTSWGFTGGDGGYRYRGVLQRNGGIFSGVVDVHRVDPSAVSIFGSIPFFKLVVSGRADRNGYVFSGHVLGWEHLKLRFRLSSVAMMAAE